MQDFINIASFTYPSELVVARSVLEANDIDCYVRDELTVQVHNFYSNAIGGIRLAVHKSKLEEATDILTASGYASFLLKDSEVVFDSLDKQKFSNFLKVAIYIVGALSIIFIAIILFLVYG